MTAESFSDKGRLLGILGGLGPMATVYFYEMLTAHTKADSDQEHIDIILSSRATTPDRTAFILGKSDESPLPAMKEELKRLERAGADVVVMPCNTAHYFIDELKENTELEMLDIIDETLAHCKRHGMKKVGLLATEGTISSHSYEKRAEKFGIDVIIPDDEGKKIISEIIYGEIKKGIPADRKKFLSVADTLFGAGCETVILGCTELSLVKKQEKLGCEFTDSLEVLAYATVKACGKTPFGFDFMQSSKNHLIL